LVAGHIPLELYLRK